VQEGILFFLNASILLPGRLCSALIRLPQWFLGLPLVEQGAEMVVGQLLEKLASCDVGSVTGHDGRSDDNYCGVPEQFGRIGHGDAEIAAKFIRPARQELDAGLPKVDHFRESTHGVAFLEDRAGECQARRKADGSVAIELLPSLVMLISRWNAGHRGIGLSNPFCLRLEKKTGAVGCGSGAILFVRRRQRRVHQLARGHSSYRSPLEGIAESPDGFVDGDRAWEIDMGRSKAFQIIQESFEFIWARQLEYDNAFAFVT
jgi:hypothetical protein